jgi:hypothetical protein
MSGARSGALIAMSGARSAAEAAKPHNKSSSGRLLPNNNTVDRTTSLAGHREWARMGAGKWHPRVCYDNNFIDGNTNDTAAPPHISMK